MSLDWEAGEENKQTNKQHQGDGGWGTLLYPKWSQYVKTETNWY